MSKQNYFTVSGTIFGIVSVTHLIRILLGWEVIIGSFSVPTWLSMVAFLAAGFLSYTSFKLGRKAK